MRLAELTPDDVVVEIGAGKKRALLAILLLVTAAALGGERSTGQVIDDATITAKVKASFYVEGMTLKPGKGNI